MTMDTWFGLDVWVWVMLAVVGMIAVNVGFLWYRFARERERQEMERRRQARELRIQEAQAWRNLTGRKAVEPKVPASAKTVTRPTSRKAESEYPQTAELFSLPSDFMPDTTRDTTPAPPPSYRPFVGEFNGGGGFGGGGASDSWSNDSSDSSSSDSSSSDSGSSSSD